MAHKVTALPVLRLLSYLTTRGQQRTILYQSRGIWNLNTQLRRTQTVSYSSSSAVQHNDDHPLTSDTLTRRASQPNLHPALVIFNKNGTLIDFHSMMSPWMQKLTERLEMSTGLKLKQRIYEVLDVCHLTNKARDGILGRGTFAQIKREIENILMEKGLVFRDAQRVMEECWQDCDMSNSKLFADTSTKLHTMFQELQKKGVKIAVYTTDTRKMTEKTLKAFNMSHYLDKVVCGDDPESVEKPIEQNVKMICRSLGVAASDTVVIGDTGLDMEIGYKAGAGLVVGVLSGIGTRLDLAPLSHLVVGNIYEAVPRILDTKLWKQKRGTKPIKEKESSDNVLSGKKASLIIFDKDGTLICFHSMWNPWADQLINKLEEETGLELRQKVLKELGYIHEHNKWGPGLFGQGTVGQNQDKIIEMLHEEGLSQEDAQSALDKSWIDGDHSDHKLMKTVDDPAALFKVLKKYGVKIAICTADSRVSTQQFVETVGLSEYVDMMVCGDDEDNVPKPAAHNAIRICKALDVDPMEAVMIGDTIADLGMGQSAELGATVGVLSGVCDVPDLAAQADHIIPSIRHVLPFVLPKKDKEVAQIIAQPSEVLQPMGQSSEVSKSISKPSEVSQSVSKPSEVLQSVSKPSEVSQPIQKQKDVSQIVSEPKNVVKPDQNSN